MKSEPSMQATVDCVSCKKAIEVDTKFCPYCRAEQKQKVYPVFVTEPPKVPEASETLHSPSYGPSDGRLVMRPSAQIWEFTEKEDPVAPGQRRPLLILDEQTVHLSHTDRQLAPEELLNRVQHLLALYQVPVGARLESACWQSDRRESRPRIVAALLEHIYSDYKMILGVDYLGRWASIKMSLAVEPPVLPPPPKPYDPLPFVPLVAIFIAVIAVCAFFVNAMIAIGLLVGSVFVWRWERDRHDTQQRESRQEYKKKIAQQRMEVEDNAKMKSLFRTYKIDDMRLFSSAMNTIFRVVLDDIVQKEGGRIARVEGGKGGFLTEDGVTSLSAAPRASDAGALEV